MLMAMKRIHPQTLSKALPKALHQALPKAVIFDLDGTLVDTAPDLIAVLDQIMQQHNLPSIPAARLRQFIGGGARALIERTLAAAHRTSDDQLLSLLEKDFLKLYTNQLARLSHPFAGTREMLDGLKDQGIVMAVCTNKRQDLAVKILRAFEIENYFAEISGSGEGLKRKPDPEPLLDLLKKLNIKNHQAVMVGDSIIDIKTARAADVAVLGVSFGYSPVPIRQLGADLCIDEWREMPQALGEITANLTAGLV